MSKYTNAQIAASLELWNEYFNTSGLMTDDEFYAMRLDERIAMLDKAYPDDGEADE